MSSSQHEFKSILNIHADAIGEPGQRYFRLLINADQGSAVLWLEKTQLYGLAISIQQLLALAYPEDTPLSELDLVSVLEIVKSLDILATKLSALLENDIADHTAWLTIAEVAEEVDTIRQMLARAHSEGAAISTLDLHNVIAMSQSLEVIITSLAALLDNDDRTTGSIDITKEALRLNIAEAVEEAEAIRRLLVITSPGESVSFPEEGSLTNPTGSANIEFQIGNLALGYNPEEDTFNLITHEDAEVEDPEKADFRCWISRQQVEDLARESLEVCAAGRPLCPLCNEPMGPSPHICPKQNGHRIG